MSAAELARELEVSARTVARDVDALSSAGVPVYAERGRHGGFALVAGYSTDLTGLTHDEALALLVAGSRGEATDAGPALASAMRKVVAGLPAASRETATRDADRILVRREGWLPPVRTEPDAPDAARLAAVRRAVFAGRRLRIRYTAGIRDEAGGEPARWRTVDPIGLVSAGGRWYLLATRDGAERSYRLSRIDGVEELDEPADRPAGIDLDREWQARREKWSASRPGLATLVRVRAERRADLVRTARSVGGEEPDGDGALLLEVEFSDTAHAEGVVWSLGADAELVEPAEVRAALVARIRRLAVHYGVVEQPRGTAT